MWQSMDNQFNKSENERRPKSRGRGRGFRQNRNYSRGGNERKFPANSNAFHRNLNDSERNRSTVVHDNGNKTSEENFNRKFEDACAKIQASLQRFVNVPELEDSSEEEEEIEKDSILKNVLGAYGDSTKNDDLQRTHQFLLDTLNAGACICLICIESVKRSESVWSCKGCFCIFHLHCVQKWSKDSIYHQTIAFENYSFQPKELFWCCPKCRKEYSRKEQPQDYFCFCGKKKNPEVDLWLIPHSCGQKCKKKLEPLCGHECLLLCHPGPCPPCPKTVNVSCFCKREKPKIRRCSDKNWSCGKICDKLLSCGQHKCSQSCHGDDCETCPHQSNQKCMCGKELCLRPCASPEWQCNTVSSLQKMALARTYHTLLRNPLEIDEHYLFVTTCCDGNCPPCEQLCGRTLNCKNHKCSSRCHLGPCYPCPKRIDVTCNCGFSKIVVPCGRQKTTKPPKCKQLCKVPPACNHETRDPHRCHFGNCPQCTQICNKVLEPCKHICNSRCHMAVLTLVTPSQKRAGPWEPAPMPYTEIQDQPCPPCMVPIPVTCLGGHETHNFPCSEVRPWSCGRKCGRLLTCSNHTCLQECHKVENPKSSYEAGDSCQTCEEPCMLPRPDGCTHPCKKPCHPSPCSICNQHLRLRCHCQLNFLYIVCFEWTSANDQRKMEMLSCQNRCPKELSCGHRCPQTCHPNECPPNEVCKKKVTVRCSCKRIKREYLCNVVTSNNITIECDEVCKELLEKERAALLEEEKRRKEEEEKKQQEELEEFKRKMEGKKRRPKKVKEIEDKVPWWKNHWKKIVIVLGGVAISVFITHVIKFSN
ncbi:NF-X1-type zinc finger protein NFXL1-like [Centruroides sculpturatus]|uniref:NF-X1-type zinc finger protein NFXL1-like n=1 Tax=Centruroides sculpturatus TaxID=218467 RepID=UPI000C6D1256|nr:NF-X1-type zinc finger protein NFXL1-like [Centruroides sculpturatus]